MEERADSPPPDCILTTEHILQHPPQAPRKKRQRRYHRSPTSTTRPLQLFPVPLVEESSTSNCTEKENESGASNDAAPTWHLAPRRRVETQAGTPNSGSQSVERLARPSRFYVHLSNTSLFERSRSMESTGRANERLFLPDVSSEHSDDDETS